MIGDLLSHFDIEELIAYRLVLRELHPELITEFLAHLLGNQRDVYQLLGLGYFLLQFQLKSHIHLDLTFKLLPERVDIFLLVELLAVEKDEFLLVRISLKSCLFQCLVHRVEFVSHFLQLVRQMLCQFEVSQHSPHAHLELACGGRTTRHRCRLL